MATLGLLAPEFDMASLEANLDAMAATGAKAVQYDLACAVGETFPERIEPALVARIRDGFAARGLTMAAISGCFNMIHPDPAERAAGLKGLARLAERAADLGTRVVTLCTGTRSRESMWRRHLDNDRPEAMADLAVTMRAAVRIAEANGVTLAMEPEVNNAVDSAKKARRLIDEIGSPALKVVMDGANIFHAGELPRMEEMLDEAFALIGADIALAHAKDLDHDGDAGHLAAGQGVLDYRRYLELLAGSGYDGAIILHALKPGEAGPALAFVRRAAPTGYV